MVVSRIVPQVSSPSGETGSIARCESCPRQNGRDSVPPSACRISPASDTNSFPFSVFELDNRPAEVLVNEQ